MADNASLLVRLGKKKVMNVIIKVLVGVVLSISPVNTIIEIYLM